MQLIRQSLIFENVFVWDNSVMEDKKVAGRYYALRYAGYYGKWYPRTQAVFFQDDDVIVPRETQEALLAAYEPGVMVANWGHGDMPDGYDDLPLVCGGAIVDADLPWQALERYTEKWPADDGFFYEADFIAGVLYPAFTHLHLPFAINMEVAQHPSRLCNQPWQKQLKLEVTNRARAIRDEALVAA
jgi:hypothetical protein